MCSTLILTIGGLTNKYPKMEVFMNLNQNVTVRMSTLLIVIMSYKMEMMTCLWTMLILI